MSKKTHYIAIGIGLCIAVFIFVYAFIIQSRSLVDFQIDVEKLVGEENNVCDPKSGYTIGQSVDMVGLASMCWDNAMVNIVDEEENILSSFGLTLGEETEDGLYRFFIDMELRKNPDTQNGFIQFFVLHNE